MAQQEISAERIKYSNTAGVNNQEYLKCSTVRQTTKLNTTPIISHTN